MPSIDSVGCRAVLRSSITMLTADSLTTMAETTSVARGGPGTAARKASLVCLLLHQLGLHGSRQLRGEVDVTRQLRLALDRVRLTRERILEDRVREVGRRRLLAPRCERHGPVDREASMIVLRRDGHQLECRVARVVRLPIAAEHVAVGGRESWNGPPALLELG